MVSEQQYYPSPIKMNKVKAIESMNLLRVGFQGQGMVGEIQVTPTQTLDSFGHRNPHYFHMKSQQHYIHQHQLVLNYHLILETEWISGALSMEVLLVSNGAKKYIIIK